MDLEFRMYSILLFDVLKKNVVSLLHICEYLDLNTNTNKARDTLETLGAQDAQRTAKWL